MESIQRLDKYDYYNGFLQLLSQKSAIDPTNYNYQTYCEGFDRLNTEVFVVCDYNSWILATATFYIDDDNCGHIIDVVVHRDKHQACYTNLLVDYLTKYANSKNCFNILKEI